MSRPSAGKSGVREPRMPSELRDNPLCIICAKLLEQGSRIIDFHFRHIDHLVPENSNFFHGS